MPNKSIKSIEVVKEIPFFGDGDSLQERLRNVSLRGFPNVKIYKGAEFELIRLNPEEIEAQLHTPQPSVYRTHLEKIEALVELFQEKGIDIMHLNKAYDFNATSEFGEVTEWTMLPPVVERFYIPTTRDGKLNYQPLISLGLKENLSREGLGLNKNLFKMNETGKNGWYNLINDGSHRVHFGVENEGVTVLRISNMTPGFPYYAAPQSYSKVEVVPERNKVAIETKVHIVEEPGHKNLYRLFPSGGIKSGEVRPENLKS